MSISEAIRRIFLDRKSAYSAAEAARLLDWSETRMVIAIAEGDVEAREGDNIWVLEWQEVAAMATAQWPQETIEKALGSEMHEVIPQLVQLAELRVRVPRYEIVMLQKLAQREGASVDSFLSQHLLDLASAESEWLRQQDPALEQAIAWPQM